MPELTDQGGRGHGMNDRAAVLAALRAAAPALRRRWPIRAIGVFGSYARGDAGPDSDVDVLVEFERPVALSAFLAIEQALRTAAGRPVDLVSRAALTPAIERHALRDLVPL